MVWHLSEEEHLAIIILFFSSTDHLSTWFLRLPCGKALVSSFVFSWWFVHVWLDSIAVSLFVNNETTILSRKVAHFAAHIEKTLSHVKHCPMWSGKRDEPGNILWGNDLHGELESSGWKDRARCQPRFEPPHSKTCCQLTFEPRYSNLLPADLWPGSKLLNTISSSIFMTSMTSPFSSSTSSSSRQKKMGDLDQDAPFPVPSLLSWSKTWFGRDLDLPCGDRDRLYLSSHHLIWGKVRFLY